MRHAVLAVVSNCCPPLEGSSSRVTHQSATKHSYHLAETSVKGAPFDLHVLSTPPAFVLSQDQTLYKMVSTRAVARANLS